jgi:hypothetical protein
VLNGNRNITIFWPLGLHKKQISVQEVGEVIVSFLVNSSAECDSYVLSYRFLPESVRWLQSQGRTSEVKAIMRRAAKINGKTLSDSEFRNFELSSAQEKTEEVS